MGAFAVLLRGILTGRPVPDHWQAMLQKVGIACILLLTSLALFNDVSRLFLARG
jgi:regulator of sigma E protease